MTKRPSPPGSTKSTSANTINRTAAQTISNTGQNRRFASTSHRLNWKRSTDDPPTRVRRSPSQKKGRVTVNQQMLRKKPELATRPVRNEQTARTRINLLVRKSDRCRGVVRPGGNPVLLLRVILQRRIFPRQKLAVTGPAMLLLDHKPQRTGVAPTLDCVPE